MRPPDRLRWATVALLLAAGFASAVGNSRHSRPIEALAWPLFLGAVFVFTAWRRAARRARGTVFDPETKTSDETRSRADQ